MGLKLIGKKMLNNSEKSTSPADAESIPMTPPSSPTYPHNIQLRRNLSQNSALLRRSQTIKAALFGTENVLDECKMRECLDNHNLQAWTKVLEMLSGEIQRLQQSEEECMKVLTEDTICFLVTVIKVMDLIIDLPGHDRIGGHYFQTSCPYVCPSVRYKNALQC